MAALLGSYSPNDINISVNKIPISGFAPGTFVTVSYQSDAATMVEGSDGTPAISFRRGARGGTVKFTLMQTSLSNNVLSALLNGQKFAASGGASVECAVSNAQGGESAIMPRGAFAKEPDLTYAEGVESREYTLIGQIFTDYAGNEV